MRRATRIKLGFLTVLVLAAVAGAPPFAAPAHATNCTRTYCDQFCSRPCTGILISCNNGNPICGCNCT